MNFKSKKNTHSKKRQSPFRFWSQKPSNLEEPMFQRSYSENYSHGHKTAGSEETWLKRPSVLGATKCLLNNRRKIHHNSQMREKKSPFPIFQASRFSPRGGPYSSHFIKVSPELFRLSTETRGQERPKEKKLNYNEPPVMDTTTSAFLSPVVSPEFIVIRLILRFLVRTNRFIIM